MHYLVKMFPAVFLFLNALVYMGTGWLFLSNPMPWFEALGIVLRDDLGYTDLRAVYGGFLVSLGVFLLLCSWWRDWRAAGTVLLLLTYAGLVAARTWGIAGLGEYNDLVLQIYVVEWVSLVLAGLAIICLRYR